MLLKKKWDVLTFLKILIKLFKTRKIPSRDKTNGFPDDKEEKFRLLNKHINKYLTYVYHADINKY